MSLTKRALRGTPDADQRIVAAHMKWHHRNGLLIPQRFRLPTVGSDRCVPLTIQLCKGQVPFFAHTRRNQAIETGRKDGVLYGKSRPTKESDKRMIGFIH